jgi:hypothetical protein
MAFALQQHYLTAIFDPMKTSAIGLFKNWKPNDLLLHRRWPWHLLFWTGYILFRFWMYYITVKYYPAVYLEYMLLSEILFIGIVYCTVWLYKRLFERKKYLLYFLTGAAGWMLYLYGRTVFQLYYLKEEQSFRGNTLADILLNNASFVLVYFLFVTSCKYFKDGYIRQQFEAEKKEQQLMAENNNLKSQIAPHFLFNTLNNLYGLAVEKSDKLPGLMLQLSGLLRHSLYEAQKPLVPLQEEISVLKSYTELERVRLENDLELHFDDAVPAGSTLHIAPLILIVFMENAFKHSRFVQPAAVQIHARTRVEGNRFYLVIKNNYSKESAVSPHGIGLTNVKRRLEVLYPDGRHQLTVSRDGSFYTVHLELELSHIA